MYATSRPATVGVAGLKINATNRLRKILQCAKGTGRRGAL
jgi:hypothetical protein